METKRKNALLTFCGEQDIVAMKHCLDAMNEMQLDESGGSYEYSIRAENNKIIIGRKMEIS